MLHADFINDQEGHHLNLDIDVRFVFLISKIDIKISTFSPPQLSFSRRQYKDEYGNIQEDPPFDGDPFHKRQYLEKYRPIDWLTEWHKTHDLTEIGSDKNLLRGGRFRFYNGIKEDIMIEEVKMSLFVFNSSKTIFMSRVFCSSETRIFMVQEELCQETKNVFTLP